MGPRNPVARGFSLERGTSSEEDSEQGIRGTRAVLRGDLSLLQTHLSLVPRTLQPVWECKRDGLRVWNRQVAGGSPRCGSPVVSHPDSGSSPDRGVASPFGDSSSPPHVSRDRARPGRSASTLALPRSGRTSREPESPGRIRGGPEAGSE